MSSIHTNVGATAALQTLRSISSAMQSTQEQVSSGLRVSSAADNAAYWSIATTMRSDNKALSAVGDALGLGAAVVETMYTGMTTALDLVSEFKAKLVAASEPGVDKTKVNKELTQLKEQLRTVAYGTSFSGQQWLHQTDENWQSFVEPQTVVAGFTRLANGSVSLQSITVMPSTSDHISATTNTPYLLIDDTGGASTGDLGILTSWRYANEVGVATQWVITHTKGAPNGTLGQEIELTNSTTTSEIEGMIKVVDAMHQRMTDVAAAYGAANMRVSLQQEFRARLSAALDSGIGRLVDADMNEASTRLKALQAQEQLGIQSLQIANTNAANVLSLFR